MSEAGNHQLIGASPREKSTADPHLARLMNLFRWLPFRAATNLSQRCFRSLSRAAIPSPFGCDSRSCCYLFRRFPPAADWTVSTSQRSPTTKLCGVSVSPSSARYIGPVVLDLTRGICISRERDETSGVIGKRRGRVGGVDTYPRTTAGKYEGLNV